MSAFIRQDGSLEPRNGDLNGHDGNRSTSRTTKDKVLMLVQEHYADFGPTLVRVPWSQGMLIGVHRWHDQ